MLRFIESFDTYQATTTTPKWDTNILTDAVTKRTGIQSAKNTIKLQKTLDAQATWVVGFAFYDSNNWIDRQIVILYDTAIIHAELRMTAAGAIAVARSGTILATSANAILTIGAWHYIEFYCTIGDAGTGNYAVRLNGIDVIPLAGGDTRNGGNPSANRITFYDAIGYIGYIDDVYIEDGTDGTATQGAPFNTFIGDCRVRASIPTADGSNSDFTPSAGVDHYALVDEIPPNEDTDYNSSATPGQKDSYQHSASGVTGTLLAVQVSARVRKDDSGLRTARTILKSGASYANGTTRAVATGYETWTDLHALNPATGLPWSEAQVDATEIGLEIIS